MAHTVFLLVETIHLALAISIGFLVLLFLRKHGKSLGTGAKLLLVGILFFVFERFLDFLGELGVAPDYWAHAAVETVMLVFFLLALIIEMRASAKKI